MMTKAKMIAICFRTYGNLLREDLDSLPGDCALRLADIIMETLDADDLKMAFATSTNDDLRDAIRIAKESDNDC